MEASRIRIADCPRCGQTHEVEVTPYRLSARRQPYTHWFMCPVTGDPSSVNLKTESEITLDQRVVAALAEAQMTGQYMVAIWRVQDGQLYRPFWLTNNFPKGDVRIGIEQLQGDMHNEMAEELPREALANANVPPLKIVSAVDEAQQPMPVADAEAESDDAGDVAAEVAGDAVTPDAAMEQLLQPAVVIGPSVDIRLDNEP